MKIRLKASSSSKAFVRRGGCWKKPVDPLAGVDGCEGAISAYCCAFVAVVNLLDNK